VLTGRRAVAVVASALLMVAVPTTAGADVPPGCHMGEITREDGRVTFGVVCPEGPSDPTDGSSGSTEPTCVLTGLAEYCIGAMACWANVPSALPEAEWPEETRPSPDAVYTFQYCEPDPAETATGWSWYTPSEMTVAQAARQAYGLLATPAFTVGFSPPGRAIVGFPTWLWAQTPESGTITGSAALGVVAIGEPDGLEVDPGDGSGVLSCAWSTVESGECAYTYGRSSVGQPVDGDGLPAYPVRMRLVYQVRFEANGTPLEVAGLLTTLESPWQTTPVPVAEIQALVTATAR